MNCLRCRCLLRAAAPLALLGFAVVALAQQPIAAPAKPATVASPASLEALALDKMIIAEGKAHSEIMTNLGYLSDVIGPRLTGSAALKRANEWAAAKMRSYGLTNVKLEPYSIPAGWERGTATARVIEPNNGRSLLIASMGWTPGTNGKVEGDVLIIQAKNPTELAKYKGKLRNAIVLRGPPSTIRPITDPTMSFGGGPSRRGGPAGKGDTPDKNGAPNKNEAPSKDAEAKKPDFGGSPKGDIQAFRDMMAFRREMADFLRAEGVAVLLQDAGKPHGLLTTTGSWRGNDRASAPDPLPSVFVAHEHYALLYRLATRPAPARTRVEIEISNQVIPGPIVVYNTVGEIRGSEKPDEFVVVGAHLDSWDLAQGTTDNGTGSSVVLEAARILGKSGVKPQRTIRFVLFTGEEQGLHGSREYVKLHEKEMPKTSMALAHDTGTGRVTGIGLQGRASIKPILDRELVSLTELGVKEINLRGMGGTDHVSFESAGVPGFAFQQDPAEYRFTHHSQSDTFDKAREADLIQGAQVMAITALRVANLPEMLPRDKLPDQQGGRGRFRDRPKEPEKPKDKND